MVPMVIDHLKGRIGLEPILSGNVNLMETEHVNGVPFTCTFSIPVSVTVTVKFTLTDGMGTEPNLSAKWSVTIGQMINFDGHGHETVCVKRPLVKCPFSNEYVVTNQKCATFVNDD